MFPRHPREIAGFGADLASSEDGFENMAAEMMLQVRSTTVTSGGAALGGGAGLKNGRALARTFGHHSPARAPSNHSPARPPGALPAALGGAVPP